MRKGKREYEMKRSKLELEKLKLMQKHNKALKKLRKWMKHKFKQKNKKGSIKLDGAVMKIKKLLAATMTERAELSSGQAGNVITGTTVRRGCTEMVFEGLKIITLRTRRALFLPMKKYLVKVSQWPFQEAVLITWLPMT
ncbi:hypothetical protein Bca101_049148 [Brassica carinata]